MSALTEALVAAQLELPTAIPRDSQGIGYRYTSLDALIAVVRPVANANGLSVTQWPSVREREDGKLASVLVTRLDHVGGEHLEYASPLYVADPTSQGFGTAVTYSRRYALSALFCIASEEDTDAADDVPF